LIFQSNSFSVISQIKRLHATFNSNTIRVFSEIYYAHEIFRGLCLGKTMPPKFRSVLFTNFLCPGNSVVKQQSTSRAFISISYPYVLVYCNVGWFYTICYSWTVIVPSKGFFCCRVTLVWKISVSKFTTDYTFTYDILKTLQEWKQVPRQQANAEKQIKCTEYRMRSYRNL